MASFDIQGDAEVHNKTFLFEFEETFDETTFRDYMTRHWADSFIYSALYIIVIFGGHHYMKDRQRYDLRPVLAIWSGLLAIFSIIGAIRTVPEMIWAVSTKGLQYSICNASFVKSNPTSVWVCLFTLSKVIELGDTVFIILRKQQLVFLHWYHHITVLLYAWASYADHVGSGRWFMVMNYTVHSVMYSYYALKAMRFQIPIVVNIAITALQIAQMIIGLSINVFVWHIKERGGSCEQSWSNIRWAAFMYFSYFFLFAHFFYVSYIAGRKTSVTDKKKL